MEKRAMNRRLAAILSADVVGYTRLMREDEEGVLEGIKSIRKLIIEPALNSRGGRIVKLMGDGLLVEFPSALEAVRASLDIQKNLAEDPSPAGITYRIGINLGDVITEDGDIFGDGVNLAARLEAAAPQGGICVAASVFDQVRDKLDIAFEDMGEIELKNVDRPIRTFQWMPRVFPKTEPQEPAPLDRPSIAVLAFTTMGADSEQDFFGDGLAEEIITGLSKLAGLLVIARDSSFVYKGRSVDAREVGRELDVRYVLVGSVRASGTRIRVSAQLVDSEQGVHIWADRYDRILDDIFEIQDEITQCVCAAIEGALSLEEQRRAQLRRPESLDAWSAYHLGIAAHYAAQQAESSEAKLEAERKAISHFERATVLDPRFARPLAARALVLRSLVIQNVLRGDEAQSAIDEAIRFCREAIALDPLDSAPHVTRGMLLGIRGMIGAEPCAQLKMASRSIRTRLPAFTSGDRSRRSDSIRRAQSRISKPALAYLRLILGCFLDFRWAAGR
ncbi:adenylate/guanylate cyclase domain-containing protein [Sulfitobacter sediminilitoris]